MEFYFLDFDETFIILSMSLLLTLFFYGKQIQPFKCFESAHNGIVPKSVNYHFTRKCNYECGFCFHTAKTSFMLNLETAKLGLQLLKNAGESPRYIVLF